jgi:hypothetical protein
MERAPLNLISDIIELRNYSKAKEMVDRAGEELPSSPIIDKVIEVEAEIVKERRAKKNV